MVLQIASKGKIHQRLVINCIKVSRTTFYFLHKSLYNSTYRMDCSCSTLEDMTSFPPSFPLCLQRWMT